MKNPVFAAAKAASRDVARLPDSLRAQILRAVADMMESRAAELLEANRGDLSRM